jgi:hypothetical protein
MTDPSRGGRPARDRPEPLASAEVTGIIRRCLTAGLVIPTEHFRSQEYLRNYTIQDALNVLRYGQVSSDAPEWNEKAGRWGYRIHGPDLEGDVLTVVVGIGADRSRVWLVTAF